MNRIETDRLILQVVPLAGLAATAAENRDAARKIISETLPEAWFDMAWVFALRQKQWIEDPHYAPWSMRAIALKSTGQIIGSMNCHHMPMSFKLDQDTILATEIGYTIFEPYRRQGYMFEALTGFLAWAKTTGLGGYVLSIAPTNEASHALAWKLGATRIGQQIDEKDGPEDIFFCEI
jgi:[ribosomal protein S5]-alanine N-acetyltransferase